MARFVTTTTADDKEIRVNMDNVRCLYLGRSGLTEIVFDGEHQVAVKGQNGNSCLENAGSALDREGILSCRRVDAAAWPCAIKFTDRPVGSIGGVGLHVGQRIPRHSVSAPSTRVSGGRADLSPW